MNAKFALALILTLQVSMCLCEAPTPSAELVEKYDGMKATFLKRLTNALAKLQLAAAPLVEKAAENEQGTAAKAFVENLSAKPEFQALVKVAGNVVNEAAPLIDKARTAALGLYEQNVRPRFGNYFSDAIDGIKVYLDKYLPAE